MRNIRLAIFLPPFLVLLAAVGLSVADRQHFLSATTAINTFILEHFGNLFTIGAFVVLVAALIAAVAPFGRVRIGGPDAKPLLRPWTWVAVSICTNTAVGILFWAAAEPIYHVVDPPVSLGIAPSSAAAGSFALSTLFMHWSFIPCAIYAVPAALFAFAFYNMKTDFSLGASLRPLLGKRLAARLSGPIDAICLYALAAGMAASLATGVLTLSGGIEHLYGLRSSPMVWTIATLTIVITFIVSAGSGLQRGISYLSSINIYVFFLLAAFVLTFGPTAFIAKLSFASLGEYIREFVPRSLMTGFRADDHWPQDWTIFYWANWLAWAPVTALFLGRTGYGYTMRAFLLVNLVTPAVFAILWMSIFGGTSIHMQLIDGLGLDTLMQKHGAESLVYKMFSTFPLAQVIVPLFLFTVFISYVSGADANTSAMAGMCTRHLAGRDSEPPLALKIIWGVTVGAMALVMLVAAGVDGIKMMSNLGGFPALIFEFLAVGALLKVALRPHLYDVHTPVAHPKATPIDPLTVETRTPALAALDSAEV